MCIRDRRTLEKNDWITITTVEQSEKPNKNVCSITEDGRTELLSWLSTQNPIGDTRVPLLMQVFFLGNRSKEENIAYFEGIASTYPVSYTHLFDSRDHGDLVGFLGRALGILSAGIVRGGGAVAVHHGGKVVILTSCLLYTSTGR